MHTMTTFRLLLRNLGYHWRGNLAVFLGVALGTAVLAGALLVGDSLRGSLRALSLDQLAWVEQALVPGRFFRAALADELPAEKHASAILLQGSASRKLRDSDDRQRVGKVTVLGVSPAFWAKDAVPEGADFWHGSSAEVVLNRSLADALGAKVGDAVSLLVQRADAIPRESLLGKRRSDDVLETLNVTVKRIVPNEGLGRFSLKPSPLPALNAFVPLGWLQAKLDQPGKANALLVQGADVSLPTALAKKLTLDDWGLRLRTPADRATSLVKFLDPRSNDGGKLKRKRWDGRVPDELAKAADANGGVLTREIVTAYYERALPYTSLESATMYLPPFVAKAAERVGADLDAKVVPSLIYLADTIAVNGVEVPYSVVASHPVSTLKKMRELVLAPRDGEVILMDWPGSPLKAKRDDKATITYYSPDAKNHLERKQVDFNVVTTFPLKDQYDDPDLTPEFPGITDKLDMSSWENPPFPYSAKRVKQADEDYWKRYRTAPKAYVSLETAKKLWGTRHGDVTSMQIYPKGKVDLAAALLAAIQPEQGGFVFQKVREQAVAASSGATDFGMLFLALSFFLIVSALLLVGLLFRLNIDRRAGEIGLLLATGWSQQQVRRLLLGEGAILAVLGGFVGLAGALAYAPLMLKLLRANWPDGESLGFLQLHAQPLSFAIGYVASLVVSLLTILWATRILGSLTPRSLLAGQTQEPGTADAPAGAVSRWLIVGSLVGAAVCVAAGVALPSADAKAGSFFGSGALLLTAALAGAWRWLKSGGRSSNPQPSVGMLGFRNASRNAVRSLLTVGLLAAATFLVVAVESFHKEPGRDFASKNSGSGGFSLLVEGAVPFYQDLNQPAVRDELNLADPLLKDVRFWPCRVQPGDDASCLNLYQPLKPKLMGVSNNLVTRGGFQFAGSQAKSDDEKANPWTLLETKLDDGAIPAIIDANIAQWIFKVSLGSVVEVNDDQGRKVSLRIVGLLHESIFQSELLIAESNFLKLYPRQEGFSFALVDTGDADPAKVKALIQKGLDGTGLDVQTTASRLQNYLAVQNTYLATFQALGGLGLVLGAAGLAIVLLRGVWERRGELALLRALGFRSGKLAWLVLAENLLLLLLGLCAGGGAALLAVAPHLLGSGADVLWLRIAALLAMVVASGLVAGLFAVWTTLRTPMIQALRRE
jgi:putative ABC transport system permease protein